MALASIPWAPSASDSTVPAPATYLPSECPARPLDRILDFTVVPGYGRVGYALRSRAWGERVPPGALVGRDVLVTGASSGIGEAAAPSSWRRGPGSTCLLAIRSGARPR